MSLTTANNIHVKVDLSKCTLCKMCIAYCPTHVFSLIENRIVADSSKCIECYGCIPLCPSGVIKIEIS